MVDYGDGYPVCVGEALQLGDVPAVGRVAVATGGGPDHLQRVGDHQREVRKAFVEIGELVQEAAGQGIGLRGKEQVAVNLVSEPPEALHDPLVGVFKREVQNGSLAHLMAPQRRSRCHADADFHAQPALADLGAAHRKPGASPMSPWMSMGLSSMGSVMRSWAVLVCREEVSLPLQSHDQVVGGCRSLVFPAQCGEDASQHPDQLR